MTNNDRDRAISKEKLNQFVMKVANDFGAAWSAVLVNIGDKLGLYKEMVNSRPITSEELAKRTGTAERYIREWLANQAAGVYVIYDSNTQKYTLPPEHVLVLVDEIVLRILWGVFKLQQHHSSKMSQKLLRRFRAEMV